MGAGACVYVCQLRAQHTAKQSKMNLFGGAGKGGMEGGEESLANVVRAAPAHGCTTVHTHARSEHEMASLPLGRSVVWGVLLALREGRGRGGVGVGVCNGGGE